jgi:hypothetical protein
MQCCQSFTNASKAFLLFENLLSLPHLLARKIKNKKPLIDYKQSNVVTFNEYSNILWQKKLEKEVVEEIKKHKKRRRKKKELNMLLIPLP